MAAVDNVMKPTAEVSLFDTRKLVQENLGKARALADSVTTIHMILDKNIGIEETVRSEGAVEPKPASQNLRFDMHTIAVDTRRELDKALESLNDFKVKLRGVRPQDRR